MDTGKTAAGGGSGLGLAGLIVYVGGRFGWHLEAGDGVAIAGTAMIVFTFIVHKGIRGVFSLAWKGEPEPVAHNPFQYPLPKKIDAPAVAPAPPVEVVPPAGATPAAADPATDAPVS